MPNVFLHHIYVMYALWFGAGVMLLIYIAYRRKRKASAKLVIRESSSGTGVAH